MSKKKLLQFFKRREEEPSMCLEMITKRVEDPSCIVSGWKRFKGTAAEPHFDVYAFSGSSKVPLDKWIHAEEEKLSVPGSYATYTSGFHVFSDEQETNKSGKIFRRVYYRGVEVIGRQDGYEVAIARQMYVPSDPDAWPPLRS
jgi:hypothetical protein